MKKLLSIDDIMVAVIASLGYCFSDLIMGVFGWPELVSDLASLVLGMVIEERVISRIAYSEAVQRDPRRRYATYAAFVAIFLVAHYASSSYLGESLVDYLMDQLLGTVSMPIVGFVLTLVKRAYRVAMIRSTYGEGADGYVFDVSEEEVAEANQENGTVTGDVDEDVTVRTKTGTYVGEEDGSCVSYLGIPYAKPPVGPLRWKAPKPLDPTDAVFEAKSFGASAVQVEYAGSIIRLHRQDEDCLTLNVFVGTDRKDAGRPVVVVFHGGDFSSGGSADPLLSGADFVEEHQDVVLCSFNYRLGILGFIDFADIEGGQAYPDAPNLGLLDQIAALTWIHDNIAAFGGDPDRITLLGFGGGASCICLLAASGRANGLFQRAFVFSGSPSAANATTDQSRALARDLARETGATTMADLVRLDTQELKDAAQRLWRHLPAPTCDGRLIPADVYQAYSDGVAAHIEFIVGIPSHAMGIVRAFVGNEKYPRMVDVIIDDLRDALRDPATRRELDLPERVDVDSSDRAATSALAEGWYALSVYRGAYWLHEGGSTVRLMCWEQKPLYESLGSGSIDAAATLLGNGKALSLYGNVLNDDLSEVLQALLAKFVQGAEPELYHNEIKNVDALTWATFPQALVVRDDRLRSKPVEGELPRIKDLTNGVAS